MKVDGKILNEYGRSLSGATIILIKDGKRQGLATISNGDGRFALESENINESDEIEVRYMGYETQFKPVSGANDLSINLVPANNELDEVLITAKIPEDEKNQQIPVKSSGKMSSRDKQILIGSILLTVGVAGVLIYKYR